MSQLHLCMIPSIAFLMSFDVTYHKHVTTPHITYHSATPFVNPINYLGSYFQDVIYLKKKKKVLILRSEEGFDRYISAKLYDNDKDKWTTELVKFPTDIRNWSCVAVNNDNYVIMAGGNERKSNDTNEIFVLDLNEMVIMKSNVKCPKMGRFDGMVMSGDFRWLVYGYLRDEERFVGDVVEIVVGYFDLTDFCGMEYLHLVSEKGMHWKILVAKILSEC